MRPVCGRDGVPELCQHSPAIALRRQFGTMTGDETGEHALRFTEGKAVFVVTKKGWEIATKLTGSHYWPDDELN